MKDSDFDLLDNLAISYFARDRQPSNRHPGSRRGRERSGQGFLNSGPTRCTYRTVMHPRILTQNQRSWTMADYIGVPRVNTLHGTFNFGDMLNDDSIGNLLRIYAAIKGGN